MTRENAGKVKEIYVRNSNEASGLDVEHFPVSQFRWFDYGSDVNAVEIEAVEEYGTVYRAEKLSWRARMFDWRGGLISKKFVHEFDSYSSNASWGVETFNDADFAGFVVNNTKALLSRNDFKLGVGQGEHVFLAVSIAARGAQEVVRVLDYGGAAGLHAAMSVRTLSDITQKWAIVETPAMINACSDLSTENIQFFETIDDALNWLGEADLVHCSGLLQYVRDPYVSVSQLLSIGAQTVLLQELVLSLGRDIIELESVWPVETQGDGNSRPLEGKSERAPSGALMPVSYVNQEKFIESLCAGYDIAYAFNGRPYKTINGIQTEAGSAYLLQRK